MIVDYKNKNPCPIKRQRSDLCGTTLIAGCAGHSKLCPVTGAAGGAYCPARELGPLLGGDLRRLVPPPCTVRRLSAGMFGRVLVLFCADIHITSAILSAFYSNVKEKIREKHFLLLPDLFAFSSAVRPAHNGSDAYCSHASPMCDGRLHSVSEHKQRALHTWFAFLATLHPTCT